MRMEKANQTLEFFQAMYQFCESNQIEFRYLPSRKQIFISLEDDLTLPQFPKTYQNVYFGVATRNGGGTKDHIVQIPALWVDIDFKNRLKDEANERLKHFPLKPSILVDSGGGYHPYWIFNEPLSKSEIPQLENILKRLATYFDGDMASTDAARILRVPGTLNLKYKPPKKVKVVHLDRKLTYELDDFDTLLPEAKTSGTTKGHTTQNELGWENEALKGVKQGVRNHTAARLAGRYVAKGLTHEEVTNILLIWNQGNRPPLPEPEIRRTITSIKAKHERNQPQKEEPLQFPYHVVAGAAGNFTKLFASYLETPSAFLYMSYLTCLGSVVGNRLTLLSEISPQPRLFVVLLGESADERKSTAIYKTVEHFRDALQSIHICWGVGSAEGLQKRLEESRLLLLCFDEFKQFVSKCKIEASVLLPCVNTLFESNRYESRTKKTDIYLEDAYLSLLAASTVSTYENIWSTQFTDIGFNNRLFLVPGSGEKRFSVPAKIPEREIHDLKRQIGRIMKLVEGKAELDLTPSARETYHEWYMSLERSVHAKRIDTYALRLMPLLAVNELKTEVDEETVKKAIALCDWQLDVRRLHDPIDADNEVARMEEKIRRVLKTNGSMKDWELKRSTNASKKGLWIYETAKRNLRGANEMGFDKKDRRYSLRYG
jgi:hypothetical protein